MPILTNLFRIICLFVFLMGSLSETLLSEETRKTTKNVGWFIRDVPVESLYHEEEENPPVKEDKKESFSTDYRLKIGDVLQLEIYGVPGTLKAAAVDPSGALNYLFVNNYLTLGLTVEEAKKGLEQELSNFFLTPILSISLIESRGENYTIAGEVFEPGVKPLRGKTTVLSAIAEAKGFTIRDFRNQLEDVADLNHSFLARNGDYVPVDFKKLIRFGDNTQNVEIKDGDFIYIPSRETDQIYILGEVRRPMTLDYFGTMNLMEAIAESGGVTPKASSRVAVLRGSLACPKKYLIDVNRIWKGCAGNFWLEPGDIVYVPPRNFIILEEIFKVSVRTFVATVFSWAGNAAFIKIQPGAGGIDGPVPVINTGP